MRARRLLAGALDIRMATQTYFAHLVYQQGLLIARMGVMTIEAHAFLEWHVVVTFRLGLHQITVAFGAKVPVLCLEQMFLVRAMGAVTSAALSKGNRFMDDRFCEGCLGIRVAGKANIVHPAFQDMHNIGPVRVMA